MYFRQTLFSSSQEKWSFQFLVMGPVLDLSLLQTGAGGDHVVQERLCRKAREIFNQIIKKYRCMQTDGPGSCDQILVLTNITLNFFTKIF